MDRRAFVKTCSIGAGLLAGTTALTLPAGASMHRYSRVRLLDHTGRPLKAANLLAGEQYVFTYPFAATPCFLLNLGQPVAGRKALRTVAGRRYDWPGGVGPQRSLVAYSAICAHKMAHPTAGISYISYRPRRDGGDPAAGVIGCCAENSRYDPASGAQVLDGPADQPLAAIVLEHDTASDGLYALGTLGGEMFERFFKTFGPRLSLEYPNGDASKPVAGEVMVKRLEEFSGNVLSC
jgi:Rieske Fe-S protein